MPSIIVLSIRARVVTAIVENFTVWANGASLFVATESNTSCSAKDPEKRAW